jgi:hypothetical protein
LSNARPSSRLEGFDGVLSVRAHCAQHGHAGAQLVEERVDVQRQAGFHRHGLQVLHAVDRAAHGEHRRHGVVKCGGRKDLPRLQVFQHQLDDAPAGAARGIDHVRAVRQHRGAAGQSHAQGFARHVHGVRRGHAGAHAGAADGVFAHAAQGFAAELAERGLHGAHEHVFDVHRPAIVVAAGLVAADHQDGGHVEAGRAHQVRGRSLVAGGQADHAVELRAFDGDFHVVYDEVAAGEDVAAVAAGADDEIAGRGGADLERDAACAADLLLHEPRDAVQMSEADGQLRRAVHHRDLGLAHVLVGEAQGGPLRASHRFAR